LVKRFVEKLVKLEQQLKYRIVKNYCKRRIRWLYQSMIAD
jgi:hypothetical protein